MREILVIDDTKNIRALLTKCLELEGYRVTTASSGTEALEAIARRNFDLVFLDIRMPEISGTEVLRRIREKGIRVPVVIITAFGTVKNAVECTQLGAVAYLQKPFTESKIKQVLAGISPLCSEREDLEHILSVAESNIKTGRLDEAETLLENALPAHHMEPGIYLLLSKVYEGLNRPEEAQKCRDISVMLKNK